MPRPARNRWLLFVLTTLGTSLGACSDDRSLLLVPDQEPLTSAAPAPATDAEMTAAHVRAHGSAAVIW